MKKNIYNKLLSFAENRPVFELGVPESASNAPKDKDGKAKEAPREKATPPDLKSEIENGIKDIETLIDNIIGEEVNEKYTQGLIDIAKTTKEKSLEEIKAKLKALNDTNISIQEKDKFISALTRKLGTTTNDFKQENVDANQNKKAEILKNHDELEKKKAELNNDNLIKIIGEKVFANSADKDAYLKGVKDSPIFNELLKGYEVAYGHLISADAAVDSESINRSLNSYKEALSSMEKPQKELLDYIEARKAMINQLGHIDSLEVTSTNTKKTKEDLGESADKFLANSASSSESLKSFLDEANNKMLLAKLADTILVETQVDISPEDIDKAMRYYALGKFDSPSEEAKSAAILDKIAELKKAGKLNYFQFNYSGFTDATRTILRPDSSNEGQQWHIQRKDALKTLLAHVSKGTVQPDSLLGFIEANRKNIQGYLNSETPAAYLQSNNLTQLFTISKGTTHGGIFDAALALSRAENMKKRIDGADAILDPDQDTITIILNTERDNSDQDRKSGFYLSVAKVPVATPSKPAQPAAAKGPGTVPARPINPASPRVQGSAGTLPSTQKTSPPPTIPKPEAVPGVPADSEKPQETSTADGGPDVEQISPVTIPSPIDLPDTRPAGFATLPEEDSDKIELNQFSQEQQNEMLEAGMENLSVIPEQQNRIKQLQLIVASLRAIKEDRKENRTWEEWVEKFADPNDLNIRSISGIDDLISYLENDGPQAILEGKTVNEFLSSEYHGKSIKNILFQYEDCKDMFEAHKDDQPISSLQFKDVATEEELMAQYKIAFNHLRERKDYFGAQRLIEEEVLGKEFAKKRAEFTDAKKNELREKAVANIAKKVSEATPAWLKQGMTEDQIDEYGKVLRDQEFAFLMNKEISEMNNGLPFELPEGAKRDLMIQYKDMMGTGEWHNFKDENWDFIIDELIVGAPLILASGGVANVAKLAVSSAARSIITTSRIARMVEAASVGSRLASAGLKLGSAGLAVTEGAAFEIAHSLLHGENLFAAPDWFQRIVISSITLKGFHMSGAKAAEYNEAITRLITKFPDKTIRSATQKLMITGGAEVGTMAVIGVALHLYQNGNLDDYDLRNELFHALITVGALRASGKVVEAGKRRFRPTEPSTGPNGEGPEATPPEGVGSGQFKSWKERFAEKFNDIKQKAKAKNFDRQFKKLNFGVGDEIKIKRSPESGGQIESGWRISGMNNDGTVIATKPTREGVSLIRILTKEEILKLNPKGPVTKSHEFEMDQKIKKQQEARRERERRAKEFYVGAEVFVERGDGRIHAALIRKIREDGTYEIEWNEPGGGKAWKGATYEQLKQWKETGPRESNQARAAKDVDILFAADGKLKTPQEIMQMEIRQLDDLATQAQILSVAKKIYSIAEGQQYTNLEVMKQKRDLMKIYHPDKFNGNPDARKIILMSQIINTAADTLKTSHAH